MLNLIQSDEFYTKCRQIASILKLIKELTNILEAQSANLTDCFIGLIKLAAAINRVDNANPWKPEVILNYNQRFVEFANDYYILSYWLHPLYRD